MLDVPDECLDIMAQIRDLEARVEILSGSRDETFNELRNVVKGTALLFLVK